MRSFLCPVAVTQRQAELAVADADLAMTDALFAQQSCRFIGQTLMFLLQQGGFVQRQQQLRAAAQVQPQ